ncbi:tetratricopeptide repeat protein [Streptomyces sp. NPDC002088]|uniref:tetratricopeptide repeat protein n=1 Tax=Streptomyces sp. NPDC002088 TaxID=3154665 RepID=UPI00332DCD78
MRAQVGRGRWRWILARLLLAPVAAAVAGLVVWAVAHFGLDKADQTSSVVGGFVGLVGLLVSLYALRSPSSADGSGGGAGDGSRDWVGSAASHPSYRAPVPQVPVRGREEELAVLRRLASGRESGLAVVCGTGGLGKTTLAAETARQARAAGRAVFWVRWQDDPSRLADDLTRVAQALGLPDGRLGEAQAGCAALVDVVWEHLMATRGWVIVVDNVDTPRRIGPGSDPLAAYRGWLRPDGAGLLLITSRDTSPVTWGPRARLLHLSPLGSRAAGTVLLDSAPTAGSAAEADALGARLGGLPLALDAAGLYLASPTSRYTTFTAYHQALDGEFGDLLGAEHPQAADPDIARTMVRHTFDLSLDQLHTDGYTLARPLLHLLALLEAAPVPRSLVTPALLTDATGQPVTAAELDAALAGLHQYGLLTAPSTPSGGAGGTVRVGQVVLHPLVREVMALTPPSSDPATAITALDTHLTRAVNDTVAAARAGWPTARLLAPHLPPLLDHAPDTTFITARNTLDDLARTLQDAGAAAETHLLHQCLLAAETHRLGPDHPDTLTTRDSLAGAVRELGRRREAADLYQRALADRIRVLGPEHPDAFASRNNLALALHELGQYQEAADLHQQVLTAAERNLGSQHIDTLTSRNNLALALNRLGRHQEAADLHRQLLTDRERILGPEHPHTLTTRDNLAGALRELGHRREAADLYQQVLADRVRILGPEHPETLTSRNNLAHALSGLGRHREAADLHQQVLTARERILGPEHPDTLISHNNLAAAQDATRRIRRIRRHLWRRARS